MRRLGEIRRIGWRGGLLLLVALVVAGWVEARFDGGSIDLRVRSVGEVQAALAARLTQARGWVGEARARPRAAPVPAERATAPARRVETAEPLEDLTWKDRRALDRLVEQATAEGAASESSPE